MLLRRRNIKHYKKHKEAARVVIFARLAFFNTFYRHEIKKVFIKNTKSRWGSCSSRGNLNFNYKVLFLPQELQDYVIAHELCHLKEFNHGKKFWALVAQTVPNYRAHRDTLRHL
jgi:predicted metal-dependent hydrolase